MENKIDKLLLDWSGRRTEIILDNQVEAKFSFDLHVRGFHVYKDVWSPLTGEERLVWFHEKENKTYEFRLPCIVMIFLEELLLDMTPVSYTCTRHEKTIYWIKNKIK